MEILSIIVGMLNILVIGLCIRYFMSGELNYKFIYRLIHILLIGTFVIFIYKIYLGDIHSGIIWFLITCGWIYNQRLYYKIIKKL